MNEKTVAELRRIYKEFYFKNSERVEIPNRISEREFGYIPFGGSMIRHLSFAADGELKAFLVREAPYSVYYSVSFYFEPTLPMNEKGWKGADVVFDVDCDDLQSPCKNVHDRWLCKACGFLGVGVRPEKCVKCGDEKIKELNWACDNCLNAAKTEAMKILDILMDDLSIQKREIKTYFSGSMGYHVAVEGSVLEELDQMARNELADYVAGTALLPEAVGVSRHANFEELTGRLPSITERGWRGRIAKYFDEYRLEDYEDEADGDVRRKIAFLYVKLGYDRFKRLLEEAAKKSGASIDSAVTTDVHRIFRLPGTLHGGTGLMKTRCEDLIDFDPFTGAVVLGDESLDVWVEHSPAFRLRDQTFGPFKAEKARLPLMAATYLMAKGLAEVI